MKLYTFPRHVYARETYWSWRAQGHTVAYALAAAADVDACPDDFACAMCAEPCVIGDAHVLRNPLGLAAGWNAQVTCSVICGRCHAWTQAKATTDAGCTYGVPCVNCGKPIDPRTSIAVSLKGVAHTYNCK